MKLEIEIGNVKLTPRLFFYLVWIGISSWLIMDSLLYKFEDYPILAIISFMFILTGILMSIILVRRE